MAAACPVERYYTTVGNTKLALRYLELVKSGSQHDSSTYYILVLQSRIF
jgi:hypothetical protein